MNYITAAVDVILQLNLSRVQSLKLPGNSQAAEAKMDP
jgi:hypothetical protein